MFPELLTKIHRGVVTKAPKLLAFPSAFVPFKVQEKVLKELLERVLSEAIEDGDLEFLAQKWLKVEVTDLKLTWFLSFEDEQLIISENIESHDVSFSGNLNELILIAGKKEDPDTLFFQRRLLIQGDTELGLEVKNLLDNIDFSTFPPLLNKGLNHFSTFIQQGLISEPSDNVLSNQKPATNED